MGKSRCSGLGNPDSGLRNHCISVTPVFVLIRSEITLDFQPIETVQSSAGLDQDRDDPGQLFWDEHVPVEATAGSAPRNGHGQDMDIFLSQDIGSQTTSSNSSAQIPVIPADITITVTVMSAGMGSSMGLGL